MTDYKKELNFERVVQASADLVFKAWTDENLVKQWWGPYGVFNPVCEVDPKVGGKIHIVMEAGEELGEAKGMQWPMDGEFIELEEPKRIVFKSTAIDKGKPVLETTTSVNFEERNGKTTIKVHVEVTNVLPGSEFAIAGMEQGWNSQFDKMVEFVNNKAG